LKYEVLANSKKSGSIFENFFLNEIRAQRFWRGKFSNFFAKSLQFSGLCLIFHKRIRENNWLIRRSMPAHTIDEVIAQLDEIMARSRRENSRLGFFAALYRQVTIMVKDYCFRPF
jgi:hypothetical protein